MASEKRTDSPVPAQSRPFEVGVFTFVDRLPDPLTGNVLGEQQRMRHLLEEIELADQVGLDVFGVGEHHRTEYLVSAPAVVLAAAAVRTRGIRLTSAVTVLGSDDPIRVFQAFSTVDLLSGGRAEIMAGRGSFVESFPLFGCDLGDYDALFAEKLELLLRLRERERVRWSGRHRPPIDDLPVYPRPVQDPLPVWLAVGGTPASAVRAGSLGLPMALAIIGGMPERFASFVELYRESGRRSGRDPAELRVSINAHGHLAGSVREAVEEAYPYHAAIMNTIGRERGWPPLTREQFAASAEERGALFLGDPEAVIEKILRQHQWFGHDRCLLQLTVGATPHDEVLRSIELLGTEVAPTVRAEIARRVEAS
jgi:probable LLM family oxidoreductase